jgi:PAS domain-containing protein
MARARRREEAKELMSAMLTGLHQRVRSVVERSVERSGSLQYVVSHLLDTARQETEDMWYRGDLGMLDERRMLGQLEAVVSEVARDLPHPVPAVRGCVLTATDEVAGAIDRGLLEEDGWHVRSVPVADVVSDLARVPSGERRLVVLVGGAAVADPELKLTVARLKAAGSRVLVVVPDQWAHAGGWQQLDADGWAGNAQTLILMARKLHSADNTFSISEVAASLRVTPHAIRAWERRYRLPIPDRDSSGQRRYTTEDVQLLLRISHAATVHGRSLKLAALEAQGFVADEVPDVFTPAPVTAIDADRPQGQPWVRVADAIPEMLMLVDGDGVIVDCNVATARARDTVRERLRGTRLTDLIIDYDRAKAVRLYRPSPRRRDGWELRMRSGASQAFLLVAFDSRVVAGKEGRLLGLIGRTIKLEVPPPPPRVTAAPTYLHI